MTSSIPFSEKKFSTFGTRRFPWIFVVAGGLALFFSIWSIWAIRSETAHRKIAALYANAFIIYDKLDFSKPYTTTQNPLIDEALSSLQKVVDTPSGRFSEWYLACSQIGFLHAYRGELEKAISSLKKVRQAPSSFMTKTQTLTALARLYLQKKDLSSAIEIYEDLQDQTTGEAHNFVLYQLALLYSTQKSSRSKALYTYRQIPPTSPLRPSADKGILLLKTSPNK